MSPIFTTKDTKVTKFRFDPKDRRDARIFFFAPSFVPFVVKNGLRPRSPTVGRRPRMVRNDLILLNPS
jgi:hypothetical protein